MKAPTLSDTPDVTCPSDLSEAERRKEVVYHEQIPDQPKSKQKKNAADKKSNFTIKAKSIPVTPKTVASSQGAMREKWLVSIYKEIENFLQNMAIQDAYLSLSAIDVGLLHLPDSIRLHDIFHTPWTAVIKASSRDRGPAMSRSST